MDSTAASPLKSSGQGLGACPHDCPDACSFATTVEHAIAIKVHGRDGLSDHVPNCERARPGVE